MNFTSLKGHPPKFKPNVILREEKEKEKIITLAEDLLVIELIFKPFSSPSLLPIAFPLLSYFSHLSLFFGVWTNYVVPDWP